ncbi:hypothetical protein SELMODRAFT_117910 [Selaginella moellendorffii]|uniref:Peroxidase n=1 Tax=Selaginella moellendorffii TaxID=88036 RepID=D8SIV1_SELML|nr:hypothetical protein SELMODRAFT_117910 [Selaginella moellendorffii]
METWRGSVLVFLLLSLSLGVLAHGESGGRKHGYHSYSRSCPQAERIIRDTLSKHAGWDRTIPAGVLRLHFHDCFVDVSSFTRFKFWFSNFAGLQGCDGSILLDSTPTDGTKVEKLSLPNFMSARGFEMIEEAKQRLEAACPGVVSCADTLAIAARDSTVMLGGKYYQVPTGRYDGRVSSQERGNTLPSPFGDASALIQNFKERGLSVQDLVVLSGGHTLGTAGCATFSNRLDNFTKTGKPDPTINPRYLSHLRRQCPAPGSPNRVELDKGSEFVFDNSYYKNLARRNGVLTSDQVLNEDSRTSHYVKNFAHKQHDFLSQFAASMVKMGYIGWKNKHNGEIRRVCSMVNTH